MRGTRTQQPDEGIQGQTALSSRHKVTEIGHARTDIAMSMSSPDQLHHPNMVFISDTKIPSWIGPARIHRARGNLNQNVNHESCPILLILSNTFIRDLLQTAQPLESLIRKIRASANFRSIRGISRYTKGMSGDRIRVHTITMLIQFIHIRDGWWRDQVNTRNNRTQLLARVTKDHHAEIKEPHKLFKGYRSPTRIPGPSGLNGNVG